MSSAVASDIVRGNISALQSASPHFSGTWLSSAAAYFESIQSSFDAKGSVLIRLPHTYIRSQRGSLLMPVRVYLLAATDAAPHTGTLRVSLGPRYMFMEPDGETVQDPPLAPRIYADTGIDEVTEDLIWYKLTLNPGQEVGHSEDTGQYPGEIGGMHYYVASLTVQAITGGAGSIRVYSIAIGEQAA